MDHNNIMQTDLPNYSEVATSFDEIDALFPPSEAHGIMCGLICAGIEGTGISYFDLILGIDKHDNSAGREFCREQLLALYQYSSNKLHEMAFDFALLLPEEDNILSLRAQALSDWCRGFTTGIELAKLDKTIFSEESTDALFHISEIAKLDYATVQVNEDDEKAYIEVMEYVRMAVLMIYAELASDQGTGKKITPHNITRADGKLH